MHNRRRAGWRFGLFAGACAASLMLSACQPQARTADRPAEQPVLATQSAADLYQAGRYREAKARAELDYKTADGAARQRAALIAGLSNQALNKTAEARAWLEPLTRADDADIAGRAAAALGVVALAGNENARAAALFGQAARQLKGDEAARAGLRAGHAYTALKQYDQAAICYQNALEAAESPAVKSAVQRFTEPGPFTVQLGLFSAKPNADRKAQEVRPKTAALGIGSPEVAPAKGKPGYIVRVGKFMNRQAASLAGDKLGTQAVVAPLD